MFESGRRQEFESKTEYQEIVDNPEQSFDSDLEKAQKEADVVRSLLENGVDKRRNNIEIQKNAEKGGSPTEITITWWDDKKRLVLTPIKEGKGVEVTVYGYTGEYVSVDDNGNVKNKETVSLKKLFQASKNKNFIIIPTNLRWAIGKDIYSIPFNENTVTLYVGLGFLLHAHQYMLVGFHEASHLEYEDEMEAWSEAMGNYAKIHKPNKGKHGGIFNFLKKREWYDDKPTIKQIADFGLTSHLTSGSVIKLTKKQKERLSKNKNDVMSKFGMVLENANHAFNEVFSGF